MIKYHHLTGLIGITLLITGMTLAVLGYLFIPYFADKFERVFLAGSRPDYGTFVLSLNQGTIREITFNDVVEGPVGFYIQIGNAIGNIKEIRPEQLSILGFKKSPIEINGGFVFETGVPQVGKQYSYAVYRVSQLLELKIAHQGIKFSASKDGPFLEIGCTFEEFQKQFGKPKRWVHPPRAVRGAT